MSTFRKWILRIAFGILEDVFKKGKYKEDFIAALNDVIDLPDFTEEEEADLFGVLYDTFGDIGLKFIKNIK